ncbi:SDR family oxidoreductase [Sediminibacterium ginsengisoli]|uniref:3-oxoacyl-[acyl-carrier protein] reductase n=1 Tax=Sediminibacterium ginsengisoli TaxID=413434 RepID=A0A1T4L555_9BACT|nr:SDR family oxidoreductase [Sediminibacterium ginsengisoli]SJZ49681.1 3-oxoacyl-[acyl-carrier protein] reductase [Sediminibacterium ginsengisoli]
MNLDLTSKTALVCGASQGLGAAVAYELALLGADVLLLARNEANLLQVKTALPCKNGQQHDLIAADSSDPAALRDKVAAYLGNERTVHIIVNNSGGPASGPLLDTAVADLDTAFRSHLITAHLLAQLLVPGMKQAGYGRIVNIVSTSVKEPIKGLGISNSIRAAVANWAKTLAGEIAMHGITVNNVLPGYTRTARLDYLFGKQAERNASTAGEIREQTVSGIPAGRLGEPAEFAAAVAFLCSPAAAYINGINLPVDGGRLNGL